MDKAAYIVKTMTSKKKAKSSKSTKDKYRNPVAQDISGPKGGSDGLYLKLVHHQKNISAQMAMILSAIDNGVNSNLTILVTSVLIQVDSAVTTSHQCLTRELYGKNDSLKPRMASFEGALYCNVAKLVKWADFDSKAQEKPGDRERVHVWIKDFETALADIVRTVKESLSNLQGEGSGGPRPRRSSFDATTMNAVSPSELPFNPHLTSLKAATMVDRKTSLPAISFSGKQFHSSYSSAKHNTRDSLGSILSESSTSDEEKRRSGSNDRVSPERAEPMSPEWDSRVRSLTDPSSFVRPIPVPPPSFPAHSTSPISIPTTTTTTTTTTTLPTSPVSMATTTPHGMERHQSVPQDRDMAYGSVPAPPPRKGHTLPRASVSPKLNGRWSPDLPPPGRGGGGGGEGGGDEPPPIPVKQKKRMVVNGQHQKPIREDYDTVPPPLPIKQRKAFASPPETPNSTPQPFVYSPAHSSRSSSLERLLDDRPPIVPVRLDSIIPRGAFNSDPPPPKPPRTDRPPSMDQHTIPRSNDDVALTIRAVRKYNEDLMKGQVGGEGEEVAPPIPLKKKTIMMYKELVQGYQFDDTIMQPLYIPLVEPPPAIPPKKRKGKKQLSRDKSPEEALRKATPEKPFSEVASSLTSSVEDLADDTDAELDINYLQCEDTSSYLLFHKEDDGGYTLRGGTVDALIAYAASTTSAVKQFTEAFLLTYYTFISPEELISKLLIRLDYFYKQQSVSVWSATTSLLVRLLNNLNRPLVEEAEVMLIEMVHQMLTNGHLKFAQLLRNALVAKLNQLIPVQKKSAPLVGPGFRSNRKFAVTDFTLDEIAKQMTVLDNELFQKVDVSEMLSWAKEQNEEKSPMLTQFTMHFNNVSQWTKTKILERGLDMRTRVKVVLHFVGIMKSLRDSFQNFNSYLAILSAIESSPISRLDWPDRVIKSLEEPRALIDNKGSFKNYRQAFAQAKPPCIPYIGLYLQDLTFIEMQPSKLEDSISINFTKRWKQFKSVDHIRFAQTRQYTFDANPDILSLFANFENCASDEQLWSLSNEIKPSTRALRAQQHSST